MWPDLMPVSLCCSLAEPRGAESGQCSLRREANNEGLIGMYRVILTSFGQEIGAAMRVRPGPLRYTNQ